MQDAPLTAGDVAAISAARLTVRGIQRRAEHRSSLHLLADAVDGDLFDVLNVARSYYPQPISDDVIYLQRDGERVAEAGMSSRTSGEPTPPAELVTMLDALTVNACRHALKAVDDRLPARDGLRAICRRAEQALFELLLTAQVIYDVPLTRVEVFGYDVEVSRQAEQPAEQPELDAERRHALTELALTEALGEPGTRTRVTLAPDLEAELGDDDQAEPA